MFSCCWRIIHAPSWENRVVSKMVKGGTMNTYIANLCLNEPAKFEILVFDDDLFLVLVRIINQIRTDVVISNVELSIGEHDLLYYNEILKCNNIDDFIKLYRRYKTHLFYIYTLELYSTDRTFKCSIYDETSFVFEFSQDYYVLELLTVINSEIQVYCKKSDVDFLVNNDNKYCLFSETLETPLKFSDINSAWFAALRLKD